MRRALLLFIPILLAGVGLLVRAPSLAAQTSVQVQIGRVVISKLADWQRGTLDGLLISNNADGECYDRQTLCKPIHPPLP